MTTSSPSPAPGFPDLATIAALANQFFQQQPGGAESVANPVTGPEDVRRPAAAPFSTQVDPFLPLGSHGLDSLVDLGSAGFVTDFTKSGLPTLPESSAAGTNLFGHVIHFDAVDSSFVNPLGSDFVVEDFTKPREDAPNFGHEVGVFGYAPQLQAGAGSKPQAKEVSGAAADFPILNERVHGKRLIWLDNAATTQKPQQVIDRISYFYEHENSNIHRAAHTIAARATDAYEYAREAARRFLNAASTDEIVFVRGTTEAINLVSKAWGEANVGEGDEILISHLEHHANIVPWQQLAQKRGAKLVVAPVDDSGQILLHEFASLISPRTKLVSVTQVSNALGTVTPTAEIVRIAHSKGVPVLIDGAQSVSHMRADVQALDADFFVFSGHKVYGPTGIGVLYAKKKILDQMEPWQGGGNMIADVTFEKTIYHGPPARFEAGTGNIADAVGLGAAIEYVESIGIERIAAHEHLLLEAATHGLRSIKGVKIIGTANEKAGVLSFILEGYTTEQVGAALDREGIAVRSGHHCAQPILRRFGLESTVRPSFAIYNTLEDLHALCSAVRKLASAK
ncbi:MAG: family 2A encapsulin nanocompartment cargo protein cysteine desulfurase [Micrococcales bacterium]